MGEHSQYILSTRELNEPLISLALEHGIVLHQHNFIAIRHLHTPQLQQAVASIDARNALVLFTSSNGVKATAALLADRSAAWQIACVGHATAAEVRQQFPRSAIVHMAENAEALSVAITNQNNYPDAFFFCGDKRLNFLPQHLMGQGILVKEFVVYETESTPTKIFDTYDGILFFSPSGVESFFSVNEIPENTILFSIGNTTANALTASSTNKIVVCDVPDKKLLLMTAIDYLKKVVN